MKQLNLVPAEELTVDGLGTAAEAVPKVLTSLANLAGTTKHMLIMRRITVKLLLPVAAELELDPSLLVPALIALHVGLAVDKELAEAASELVVWSQLSEARITPPVCVCIFKWHFVTCFFFFS